MKGDIYYKQVTNDGELVKEKHHNLSIVYPARQIYRCSRDSILLEFTEPVFYKREDGNVEIVYEKEDNFELFGVAMKKKADKVDVHHAQQKHGTNMKCVITNLHNDHHVTTHSPLKSKSNTFLA